MPSITNLEKSVKTLAAKLEKDGYSCEVTTVKSGRGNTCPLTGFVSFVELDVTYGDLFDSFKFIANDYSTFGSSDICGDSFKEMKLAFMARFKKTFIYV